MEEGGGEAEEGRGTKRSFMSLLQANMERRRAARREGGDGPLPQLLQTPKRQRKVGGLRSSLGS